MLGEGDGRKVKEIGERKEEINPRRWEFFSYQEVFCKADANYIGYSVTLM
jgi:hypothetical protein